MNLEIGILIHLETMLKINSRNMKIQSGTAPEITLRLLCCGSHCVKFAMKSARESKLYLQKHFRTYLTLHQASDQQQNTKTEAREPSIVSHPESATRLSFGALGFELHLANALSD
jgi:hypothetical protein